MEATCCIPQVVWDAALFIWAQEMLQLLSGFVMPFFWLLVLGFLGGLGFFFVLGFFGVFFYYTCVQVKFKLD